MGLSWAAPPALWEAACGGQPIILTREGAPALVVLDLDPTARPSWGGGGDVTEDLDLSLRHPHRHGEFLARERDH